MHDHHDAYRSGNKTRAEEQAEELLEIAEATNNAVTAIQPKAKPVSERQRRRQRDDLVQLLDELKDQTVVPEDS